MAETPSNMLALSTPAPDFMLMDTVSGNYLRLSDVRGDLGTVVMFICNHCPFVKHVNAELVNIAKEYIPKGISFVAISSNDVEKYPDDSPEEMKRWAAELGYGFPYLYDETQDVARAYQAACTPDFYLFNRDLELVYRGRLDETRPNGWQAAHGADLRKALDLVLVNRPIPTEQFPSVGCNIKWKS